MGSGRPSHLDVPPASSSEEEDETSSEAEEEEASQDMEAQPTPKTEHSEGEEEEDETSSEAEEEEASQDMEAQPTPKREHSEGEEEEDETSSEAEEEEASQDMEAQPTPKTEHSDSEEGDETSSEGGDETSSERGGEISSEEVDETSSEGKEEEASHDMEAQPTPKTEHSDSDDESSSESKPDESRVKPIASKPVDKKGISKPSVVAEKESTAKRPRSDSLPSVVATPNKKLAAKRPQEAVDSKKQGKKSGSEAMEEEEEEPAEEEPKTSGGGDDSKKLFQRFWSEEDEIIILKGMIKYASKKGAGPAFEMNAFHDFIKKSLHAEGSKAQLTDKIRRLKKKYGNNAKRNNFNPTKPHEQKVFELSKKIWGSNGGAERATTAAKSARTSNGKAPHASPAVVTEGSRKAGIDGNASVSAIVNEMIGCCVMSLPEHVVKKGLDLIPESKKAELDEKWRKLHIDELEHFAKKHRLISEVLEKIKSSLMTGNLEV